MLCYSNLTSCRLSSLSSVSSTATAPKSILSSSNGYAVLKRDNVVEAISICDATQNRGASGQNSHIESRRRTGTGPRNAEEAGFAEVPRLEEKLNLLATIAQLAPLLGLLGTVIGFMETYRQMMKSGVHTYVTDLFGGIWPALNCATGLAWPFQPMPRITIW